jgi:hypothetical protein
MKVYAKFYEPDLTGKLVPALGSDSVAVLDGRFGLERLTEAARSILRSLAVVQPGYCGFVIYRGSRFGEGREVYREILKR